MIRRSYLPALALCTVVWGPASANSFSEVVDQGSYSQTGDIYSQGMTAQGGPWAGDTYSQGMMMSNGQIYSLGMTLTFTQGNSSGSNYGNSTSGGYNSTSGGYSSGIGSDSGQPGSNSPGGDPSSDAFTNLTFDASGVGSPGGGGPDDGPLTWASFDGYNGGNGNNGGNDDFGPHNPPPNDHHSVPEPTTFHLLVAAFLGLAFNWSARLAQAGGEPSSGCIGGEVVGCRAAEHREKASGIDEACRENRPLGDTRGDAHQHDRANHAGEIADRVYDWV